VAVSVVLVAVVAVAVVSVVVLVSVSVFVVVEDVLVAVLVVVSAAAKVHVPLLASPTHSQQLQLVPEPHVVDEPVQAGCVEQLFAVHDACTCLARASTAHATTKFRMSGACHLSGAI